MEKTIINQIQIAVPQLLALSKSKKNMSFDYDKKADVLYISFHNPQQATDTDIVNDDILIRKRGNAIVGITVMHASKFQ